MKPFSINAKDGSEFIVDPTISLKVSRWEFTCNI